MAAWFVNVLRPSAVERDALIRFLVLLFLTAPLLAGSVQAQEQTDPQVRFVLHFTKDVRKNWFGAGWIIGNVRERASNNLNVIAGIGYRRSKWWLETMAQRQWGEGGEAWLLDWRSVIQPHNRLVIYLEGAPFLDRRAFYNMATVDYRVWNKLGLGVETENVHKLGKDSLAFGPRVSLSLARIAGGQTTAVLAYRFRSYSELNELRFYLILNRRFK